MQRSARCKLDDPSSVAAVTCLPGMNKAEEGSGRPAPGPPLQLFRLVGSFPAHFLLVTLRELLGVLDLSGSFF